jgi:spore coat polysaccharide biosynthesis predicted glycosyltransferase SpsG
MRNTVLFRADASPMLGYGHFIRSLALADMLKDHFDCTFVTQEPTETQRKQVAPICNLVEMPSDTSKFDKFIGMLHGDETVVLDNYYFTTDYQKQVKAKGCKLVCIDDMHDKHYVADVVINHSLAQKSLFSVEKYTKLCLGAEWALLRRPFLSQPKHKRIVDKRALTVCTVFGGADYFDLTDKAVRILKTLPDVFQIKAVVGFDKQKPDDDSEKVGYYHNLSAEGMVHLFQDSDIALLPTSTVCLEAFACGLPVIGGFFVDNQKEICVQYVKDSVIIGIGDLRKNLTEKYLSKAFDSSVRGKHTEFDQSVFAGISEKYVKLFRDL